ncbi:NAD-dependent DNA ligase LigA [Buchnera aphidicola (Ceratoglyphina bambusae)]|uniref:NAD-dependent DNA ligase LigA n=1 Tax=Buchnera aphidicola TaxID=9 RepID=UPI0031B84506
MISNIKNKIIKLKKKIKLYEYFYNVLNISLVSDYKYDKLMEYLYKLEHKYKFINSNDSPTKKIGDNFLNEFKISNHLLPMLSLDSVYNKDRVLNFYNYIKKCVKKEYFDFCCELKIDGVALNVLYKDGSLVHALTRGNGYSGEDVTSNINIINNLPRKLLGMQFPEILEVRGEVFMLKSDFINLNKNLNKNFSNPRNIASGSLRKNKKLSNVNLNRKLFFFAYGIGFVKPENYFLSHFNMLKKLKSFGFCINAYNLYCNSLKKIFSFFYKSVLLKEKLNFEIDGIVIKVDSIKYQKKIGHTYKFPKWAIALKFDTEILKSKVLGVDFKVGRTGVITPVANLSPINFSGVIVKNVSIYNENEIKKLNLKIGSYVFVKRSGNVIPKIVKVINNKFEKEIIFPVICPCCKSNLLFNKKKKTSRCINGIFCKKQKEKLILHFFSKNGFYINGIGPKLIKKLVNLNYINNPLDVFNLNIKILCKLDKINKKSASNIVNRLRKFKNINFFNFIYSLGIPEVGISTSKNISEEFSSLKEMMNASYKRFIKIKNIGNKVAKNIFNFINSSNNIKYINRISKVIKILF